MEAGERQGRLGTQARRASAGPPPPVCGGLSWGEPSAPHTGSGPWTPTQGLPSACGVSPRLAWPSGLLLAENSAGAWPPPALPCLSFPRCISALRWLLRRRPGRPQVCLCPCEGVLESPPGTRLMWRSLSVLVEEAASSPGVWSGALRAGGHGGWAGGGSASCSRCSLPGQGHQEDGPLALGGLWPGGAPSLLGPTTSLFRRRWTLQDTS